MSKTIEASSVYVISDGTKDFPLVRRMDTVGDGSGSHDQSVDGSSTAQIFRIKPDAGQTIDIARLVFYIEDGSSIDSGGWGSIPALSNGCEIRRVQDGVTYALEPMKTNGELAGNMYDVSVHTWGSGNQFLVGRLSFNKFAECIRLIGDNGDELQFVIQDNLTGLDLQYVTAQGFVEDMKY